MRIALARLLLSEPDLLLLDEVQCSLMTSFTCMLCVNHTCSACTGQGKSSDSYHRSIVLTSHTHNHCSYLLQQTYPAQPTNHLDKGARDWLGDYLSRYDGTLLVVSHDENLLQAAVSSIAEVRSGNVELYKSRSHDQVRHYTMQDGVHH
jgi:ABC-type uncharacterized transport system ATPase subunit